MKKIFIFFISSSVLATTTNVGRSRFGTSATYKGGNLAQANIQPVGATKNTVVTLTSGTYQLAEDITFIAAVVGEVIYDITESNVVLDLNQKKIMAGDSS